MKDTTRIWQLFQSYWSADREDYDTTLTDILADLRHLADEYGMDWYGSQARADSHYLEESHA